MNHPLLTFFTSVLIYKATFILYFHFLYSRICLKNPYHLNFLHVCTLIFLFKTFCCPVSKQPSSVLFIYIKKYLPRKGPFTLNSGEKKF